MSVLAGGCSIPIVLFLLLISSPNSLVRCLWDIETNETWFESSLSTSTIDTNLTKIQPDDDDQSPKNVSSRSKSVFIDTNDFERLRQKLQILRIIQFRDQLLFSTNYLKLSNLTNAANEELFSSEAPQQIRFSYDLKSKVIRLLPQVTYLDSLYKFQPVYGLSSMLVISAQKIPSVKNLSTPLRDCLYPNIPILPPPPTTTTTTTTTLAPTTRATTHKARTIHGRIKSKILRFSRKVRRTIKTTSTTTAASLLNEIDLVDGKNSSLPLMRSIEIKENSQLNNDEQSFQVETFVYGVNSRSNSDSKSITMVSMSLICDRRSKDKNGVLNSSSKYGFIFSDNCRAANMKSAEELEHKDDEDYEDYEDEEPNHPKVSVIELGIDNRLLYSIVQIENETIFLARDDPNNPIEFKNYSGLHPNILIIPNLHRFWGSFYYRRYLNVLLPGNIIYRYSLTHINKALRTDQFLHSPDEMTTVDSIFGNLNWKDAILSLIANDHEIQRIFIKSEEEQTRLTIIAIILLLCLFVAILIFIAICISRDRGGGDDAKDDLYQEPSLSLTTSRPKGASKPLLVPGSRVKQPGQQYPIKYGQSMSKHAMKPYDMPTATNASDYMTVNDSNFDDIYKFKSAEDFVKTVNAVTATDDSRMS